ncbi:Flagellar hook-associated protein FlgK [Clostridium sp. IBUN13A]|nr:hypothetical protein ClosIBUN22A_CONTIG208g01629 [Clostridium sp. IBUN22A]KJZ87589.1 hypothetical protein ClosIBUN125C_CONTIG31g01708 [Clostridium sp. IBUN125C]KJZ92626.1 hypothetical protein ClosIBUN62F_CONTIG52g01893 [Clostridium sp. IBUN62F]KJZ97644.1 Flagellar hook-associated protein FlgK [Clostridium sp. IBUN13A]
MMENIFTYNSYKKILIKMKEIGDIITFDMYNNKCQNGFILRHDVDFDLEKAYDMFKLENELNVKSTYFVLVTSDLYNVNSKRNRKILIEMCQNGFEVGLHFDPVVYGDITLEELETNAKKEIDIIESIIDKKVESISLHNPSIHNMYPQFKGYKNAYSSKFFNSELYISDSCKNFRGKELIKFIEKANQNLLQVVFHPIHFDQHESSYLDSFSTIIEKRINDFDKLMYVNKTYQNELNNKTLLEYFNIYLREKNNDKEV